MGSGPGNLTRAPAYPQGLLTRLADQLVSDLDLPTNWCRTFTHTKALLKPDSFTVGQSSANA